MEKLYPIKYVLMPIFKQNSEEKTDDNIMCYIISKCYLVNEEKKYFPNGTYKTNYQVVFAFSSDDYDVWVKQSPVFDTNEKCLNSVIVNQIFNSLDLALSVKKQKNYELLAKEFNNISEEKCIEIRKEFIDKLDYYEQLEDEIRNIDLFSEKQVGLIDLNNNTKKVFTYENGKPYIMETSMTKAKIKTIM